MVTMGQMTNPEFFVGFDEKMELGRAVWWRLLSRLVVNSWRERQGNLSAIQFGCI
jgi:hypothetical protein